MVPTKKAKKIEGIKITITGRWCLNDVDVLCIRLQPSFMSYDPFIPDKKFELFQPSPLLKQWQIEYFPPG
jgi:hypothetical protein